MQTVSKTTSRMKGKIRPGVGGRPSKGRNAIVTFHTNEALKKRVFKGAKNAGVSVSDFLNKLLDEHV
jgi:hypothetical protein